MESENEKESPFFLFSFAPHTLKAPPVLSEKKPLLCRLDSGEICNYNSHFMLSWCTRWWKRLSLEMKSWSLTIQMKATQGRAFLWYCQFVMLYKVVLTLKTVDQILKFIYPNESYWAVPCCVAIYYAVQGGSNVQSVDNIQKYDFQNKSYRAKSSLLDDKKCQNHKKKKFWNNHDRSRLLWGSFLSL